MFSICRAVYLLRRLEFGQHTGGANGANGDD
jgi:hypothetical protein